MNVAATKYCPRPYSIKTRIKTRNNGATKPYRPRPYSIKTRIKTLTKMQAAGDKEVRDHIPLKQGLRLY